MKVILYLHRHAQYDTQPEPAPDGRKPPSAKSHITRLFDRLSATNRVQPAIAAFRAGTIE